MFVRVIDTDPTQMSPAGRRSCHVEAVDGEAARYRLDLRGDLRGGWADQLCRGLGESGLLIERGFARRLGEDDWQARFQLERLPGGADPLMVDVLDMANAAERPVALHALGDCAHRLEPSRALGGSLFLEVTGPDRTGLLGQILERFTELDLVPEEMTIETAAGAVFDRFYLKTASGEPPDPARAQALGQALSGDA